MMLEFGIVNALLNGVQKSLLRHTLDPQVASALIHTLEVFTRRSVTDSVIELVEKSEENRKKVSKNICVKKNPKRPSSDYLSRTITIGMSQQSEANFDDDAMLENGFDEEIAELTTRRSARQESLDLSEMDEVYEEVDDNDEYEDGDEGEEDDDDDDEEEDMEISDEE